MRKLLNHEMDKFLRENAKGNRISALTQMLNAEFGTNYTNNQIKQYASRHGIRNGLQHVGKKGSRLTTKEIDDFIKNNVKGRTTCELTILVNAEFGTSYTVTQIKAYKKRNNLKSGLDFRFKKGQEPFNKGLRGQCAEGSKKGWFKKGNRPLNYKPVGSERVDVYGYTLVKIAEPSTWKLKHRFVWEKHNGPIKPGDTVIFLDGDKTNFDIKNLACISRNELKTLNKNGLRYENSEATRLGITIAKVIIAKQKRKKSK